MRKILYNQSIYDNKELEKDLIQLYKITKKIRGVESDVSDVIEFSVEHYLANYHLPTKTMILESFPSFLFIEEKFADLIEFRDYIREKLVFYRDKLRNDKIIEYLSIKDNSERLILLEEVIKLETEISSSISSLREFKDYDAKEMYSKRQKIGEGPKTNIEDVDAIIGGFTSGKMMVIAAPPKCFKTSQMINMAYIGVMEYESSSNNTLIITMEIPKDELFWKIIMRHAYKFKWSVNVNKILKGLLTLDEETKLMEIVDDFHLNKKHNLFMLDSTELQLESILGFKQQLIDYIEKHEIKTIYVDYIQMFKNYKIKGYRDGFDMLNDLVGMFHLIEVTTGVRVGLLSQMNREGGRRSEKTEGKFSLHHLAEVNALERYAYYILTLYANEELKSSNQCKFQLLAYRDGQTIEDPKFTFILPEYFLIGKNNDCDFNKLTFIDDKKIETMSDNDLIDINIFD